MTTAQRSEIENDTECRINAAHLVEAEEPDALAEPGRQVVDAVSATENRRRGPQDHQEIAHSEVTLRTI